MLNCRQVSRLVSQAMDVKLPWHQRLGVRLHLLYCAWCRRYAAQVQFLRKATTHLAQQPIEGKGPKLSQEAKNQMRQRLQDAMKNPPPPPSA